MADLGSGLPSSSAGGQSKVIGFQSAPPLISKFQTSVVPPKAKPPKRSYGKKIVENGVVAETLFVDIRDPVVSADKDKRLVNPKAKYTVAQEQAEAEMMSQAVTNPPSPVDFAGLQVPSSMSIELEPNQAPQVELSDGMLRGLSPFMIRVEPPLVYGEDGGFQNKKKNSVATDFSVGSGGGTDLTGYNTARKALAQSGLSGFGVGKSRIGSVQETVSANGRGVKGNRSPTGGMTDDGGNLGQPAIVDVYAAVDIARQLAAVFNTPPLVLLVNPTTLAVAYTKIQQYSERTRHGFIFQVWGEEQPKLQITMRCGAFISGGRGVQFASRRDSKAWQNLMNAFQLFRNAGYIHDTVGKSNAHHMVGSLSIRYDGWIYYGNIESFSFTMDDDHTNGGVEFSMDFTVSAMVDTAQQPFSVAPMKSPTPSPSDPRYRGLINQSKNQPGEFSVGKDKDGKLMLRTQGGEVDTGDVFLTMVPQSSAGTFGFFGKSIASFRTPDSTKIAKPVPPSNKGFDLQPVPVGPGERSVSVANPNSIDPFRVRSST